MLPLYAYNVLLSNQPTNELTEWKAFGGLDTQEIPNIFGNPNSVWYSQDLSLGLCLESDELSPYYSSLFL
jgi:hypothetical protein